MKLTAKQLLTRNESAKPDLSTYTEKAGILVPPKNTGIKASDCYFGSDDSLLELSQIDSRRKSTTNLSRPI